jgi:nucleoid DNA-binding protein
VPRIWGHVQSGAALLKGVRGNGARFRTKLSAGADARVSCPPLHSMLWFAPNHAERVVPLQSQRGAGRMAKKGGAPSKAEIVAQICKDADLSRAQVGSVFESLNKIIKKSLKSGGLFTMPGLLKMKVVKKPATPERQGVNPFTKQPMVFKAKAASKKVRVLPLKNLKDFVN